MPDKGKVKHSRLAHGNARTTGRLGAVASEVEAQGSTDHLPPTFSFKHVDPDNYPLHEWQKLELKLLIEQLRMMENMTWLDIKKSGGYGPKSGGVGFKPLNVRTLRCHVPERLRGVDLTEIRITQRLRIMGFRDHATYCIVWFDREHDVTS